MSDPNEATAMQTTADGTPSGTPGGGAPLPTITFSHPDLKRTLKDLLVADEVSDSDVEMIERASVYEDKLDGTDNAEAVDPDMCVECGDQVPARSHYRDHSSVLCSASLAPEMSREMGD
jgi:hypothetical protein